jgi:hypothetical protein
MTKYKRIDVTTLAGLKEAERLQARGWKPISGYLFTVLMEKREPASVPCSNMREFDAL